MPTAPATTITPHPDLGHVEVTCTCGWRVTCRDVEFAGVLSAGHLQQQHLLANQ